jgi:hypothetical protein
LRDILAKSSLSSGSNDGAQFSSSSSGLYGKLTFSPSSDAKGQLHQKGGKKNIDLEAKDPTAADEGGKKNDVAEEGFEAKGPTAAKEGGKKDGVAEEGLEAKGPTCI